MKSRLAAEEISGTPSGLAPHQHRTLFIDVSRIFVADSGTGIQRVVRAIYRNFLTMTDRDVHAVPVVATKFGTYRVVNTAFLDMPPKEQLLGELIQPRRGDAFLGLDLSAHRTLWRHRRLKKWRSSGVFIGFVVYDVLPILRPDWFDEKLVRRFQRWFAMISQSSDTLFCISHSVRKNIKELWSAGVNGDIDLPKLEVISLGSDMDSEAGQQRPATTHVFARPPAQSFALVVGTLEPRKGHKDILDAFDELWRLNVNATWGLVIVGKRGWKADALAHRIQRHPELGKRLFWFKDVSDANLIEFYVAAKFVIAASYDEGYGLPVIEAARFGKPVVARDIPVFREIALPGTQFFDDCESSLIDRCVQIFSDLSAAPLPYFSQSPLTWRDTSEILMRTLREEMAKRTRGRDSITIA